MRLLLPLLTCLLSLTLANSPQPKLKALILDGQNNHKWDITTPVLRHALESSGAFTVAVSTTPPKGAPKEAWATWKPDFTAYDVVVSNYNGETWPDSVRTAFEAYVKNGGGFVPVHAANNAFGDWPEYNRIIGVAAGAVAMKNPAPGSTSKTANSSATPPPAKAAPTAPSTNSSSKSKPRTTPSPKASPTAGSTPRTNSTAASAAPPKTSPFSPPPPQTSPPSKNPA